MEKFGERYEIMHHSIMGMGCAKRFGALNLSLIERILWAWILTLPAAGGVAYLLVKAFRFCGWIP